MENEMRDALQRMSRKRATTMPAVLGAPYDLSIGPDVSVRESYETFARRLKRGLWGSALEMELAAFDEVIGLQNLADKAAFDPEKFLDEIHKIENE